MAFVILWLNVGDVEESITTDREVNKRGLDGRFEIHDLTFVDVACVAFQACTFDVELLKNAVLDNCDSAFLGLQYVDQHFFLHADVFLDTIKVCVVGEMGQSIAVRFRRSRSRFPGSLLEGPASRSTRRGDQRERKVPDVSRLKG